MKNDTALTPQEVADILKIAKNTVYELIKRNELKAYKVGKKYRIDAGDVETYKNSTKNTGDTSIIESDKLRSNPLLHEDFPLNHGFVICGQDVLLDILSRHLQTHPNGILALRSYIGSYNGLYELYQGRVQIATAHLWDGDSGQYNIPYVRRLLPGIPSVIIHLACRQQGFYVSKGNPKGIKGWDDLKREDITLINREKGSGTRILLDEKLRLMGISSDSIKGYDRESTSHLTIASTVARGGADVGMGNEKVSLQVKNVDFIPLQTERYELIMKKEDMHKPPFQAIIKIIGSDDFKMELDGIGGYDLSDTGKIIAQV